MKKANFKVEVEQTKGGWNTKSNMSGDGEALIVGISTLIHNMIKKMDNDGAEEDIEALETIIKAIKSKISGMMLQDSFEKLTKDLDPKTMLKDVLKSLLDDDDEDEEEEEDD